MTNRESQSDNPAIIVDAQLEWLVTGRPPEVMLAFDGLHQPEELWADLSALGWIVPPRPPPPGSAIEWTPDPVAGTDYTITSWRVREFRLRHGEWSAAQKEAISDSTLAVMQRNGVRINGAFAPEPVAEESPSASAPAEPASAPVARAATVIMLDPIISSEDSPGPGVLTWIGISGREKRTCTWNEIPAGTPSIRLDDDNIGSLIERSGSAWTIDGEVPEQALASSASIRIILPGTSASDSKVKKLTKMLGKQLVVLPLLPIPENQDEPAVLLCACIAANATEMLSSNIRLRHPRAIIRTND